MAYSVTEPLDSYYIGDTPGTLTVTLEDDEGNEVALTNVTAAEATLNGTTVPASVDEDSIVLTLPADSLFTSSGLYPLGLVLSTGAGRYRVAPAWIVVEDPDGWHTLASIRTEWRDAADIPDTQLYSLLSTARFQCEEFAPAYDGQAPLRYRQAQAMQARNLYIATKADPSGNVGDEGFTIRPFPMDWVVKGILRPKRGRPVAA